MRPIMAPASVAWSHAIMDSIWRETTCSSLRGSSAFYSHTVDGRFMSVGWVVQPFNSRLKVRLMLSRDLNNWWRRRHFP